MIRAFCPDNDWKLMVDCSVAKFRGAETVQGQMLAESLDCCFQLVDADCFVVLMGRHCSDGNQSLHSFVYVPLSKTAISTLIEHASIYQYLLGDEYQCLTWGLRRSHHRSLGRTEESSELRTDTVPLILDFDLVAMGVFD
jgi:hypothetical protein